MSGNSAEIDIHLWQRIIESDEPSFVLLYKKYSSALFVAAFRLLKDEALCEDIIQEVFVHLWLKRTDLRIGNIRSYLYQSVKNKVIDLIRSKKVYMELSELEDTIATDKTDSRVLQKEVETAIDQSMQTLPQRCADIFYLKKELHLSNKEIAEKLNISIKTVENQITIAVKKLKIALSNHIDIFIPAFFILFSHLL